MKIVITTNKNDERQAPEVTINTKGLTYPYAIKNAIELALSIDGYTQQVIDQVFNQYQDKACEPDELPTPTICTEADLKTKNLDSRFCRCVKLLLEGKLPLCVEDTETFDRLSKYFIERRITLKEMDREELVLELSDEFKYLSNDAKLLIK